MSGLAAAADPASVMFRAGQRMLLGGAVAVLALIYAPVLWLALLSVSADPLSGRVGGFTLGWYAALAADGSWVQPLWRSLGIAALVSLACMATALPVGRALSRMRRRRSLLVAGLLLPLGVPGTVIGLLIFTCYRLVFGLHMGVWSLALAHFVWALPFALIGMLVATNRFDDTLLEAAGDLGASPWARIWSIEIPLLRAGIFSAGLFGFLLSFTELPRSIFVAGAMQTLPLYSWAQASAHSSHVPLIFCLNSCITLVSIAASVLIVRLLGGRPR